MVAKTNSGCKRIRVLERDVERQLVDYLRLHGWRVHRIEADVWRSKRRSAREEPGTPDFICLRPAGSQGLAQAFYLEAKRPGGRLRATQSLWISEARARGLTVIVADGVESLISELNLAGVGEDRAHTTTARKSVSRVQACPHRARL